MKKLILITMILLSQAAKADSYQISFFGLTHHGLPAVEPGEDGINMKSKLDKFGVWAYNPQFNFTRYKDNGDLLNVSFVADCYQNAALNLALGKRYKHNDSFSYGYVYGLYFRPAPNLKNDTAFKITENHQLFPTAAGILQYKVTDKITLRLTANYVINFFDIAFEF